MYEHHYFQAEKFSILSNPETVGRPSVFLRVFWCDQIALVYHSLLGNLRYSEPEIVDFLNLVEQGTSLGELRTRFSDFDIDAEFARLRRLGFLVVQKEDELIRQQISRQNTKFKNGELVRTLRLNVCLDCNFSCSYCYGTNDPRGGPNIMSLATALRALQAYTSLLLDNGSKQMQIRLFGGEPLLNWQVVHDVMGEARKLAEEKQLQLVMYLNTNGVLITPNIARELKPYSPSLAVIVSLDGPPEAHNVARRFRNGTGSFDRVLNGIELLQKEGILVVISATLGTHNQNYLHELIDLLVTRGIHWMGLNPIIVTGDNASNYLIETMIDAIEYGEKRSFRVSGLWDRVCSRLIQGAYGAYCGAIGGELSVMPNGDIYPCQAQPFLLGTLADLENRTLFSTATYQKVAMRTAGNLPECRGCDFEGLCAGGCTADAFSIRGAIDGKTQHCDFIRALLQYKLMTLGRQELIRLGRKLPSDDGWKIWRPDRLQMQDDV